MRLTSNSIAIKPSGIPYDRISPFDVSVITFPYGTDEYVHIQGRKPSVDTLNHWAMYVRNPQIESICHTHSPYATAFAIHGAEIKCVSTEQADYFGGIIHCKPYAGMEWGRLFVPTRGACLLQNHGVVTFGRSPIDAVQLAIAVENVAEKYHLASQLSPRPPSLSEGEIAAWYVRYTTQYGQ